MIISKKCLKCGQVAAVETTTTSACPACGAIYDKVEAAMATPAAPTTPQRPAPSVRQPPSRRAPFIDTLRAESHYPTFRQVVNVAYWLGMVIAALLFGASIFGTNASGSPTSTVITIGAAFILAVVSQASKEAAIMLADMSDATVRMAARQETNTQ
ncbi:MAG: hypothetical protein ACREVW_00995 [Burkholderiales bacterium]